MTKTYALILLTLLCLPTKSPALVIRTTSYCPQEEGGFYGCRGKRLQRGDCAADLRYYPLGTRLNIGGQTYVVNDCGSGVRGRDHIDIFCLTRKAMNARGTIYKDVKVYSKPNSITTFTRNRWKRPFNRAHNKDLWSCIYNSKRRPNSKFSDNTIFVCAL